MTMTETPDPKDGKPLMFAAMDAMFANMPSEEEMDRARAGRIKWSQDNLTLEDGVRDHDGASPIRFNVLSLPAWLALADRAGVPLIPARPLAEMGADDFMQLGEQTPEAKAAEAVYEAFEMQILSGLQDGEMIRMEQVAPAEIKHLMSTGDDLGDGTFHSDHFGRNILMLHEDRYCSTLSDLATGRVRAFARPVMTPAKVAGSYDGAAGAWPAEFRVFVEDGRVVGVSNYYVQVALDPDTWTDAMRESVHLAQQMIDTMAELRIGVGNFGLAPDAYTQARRRHGAAVRKDAAPAWADAAWGRQDFTLDFMALETGDVVFLEGGPAGLLAAHPCCFAQDGREMAADYLHGAVFSATGPIMPLADLMVGPEDRPDI